VSPAAAWLAACAPEPSRVQSGPGMADGSPPRSRRQIVLAALRVRTLPAAVVPVAVGCALGARAHTFEPRLAACALGAAVAIQMGTNLANDWGDFRRGADGPERLGPLRAAQSGLVSPAAVALGAVGAFVVAVALGLPLIAHGGLPILAIGVASIAAGVAYTAGPFPLAYHGLGEVFVLVFFGPVAVTGTELALAGRVTTLGWAVSIPVGVLATSILLVNNIRDIDGDRRAGKRTLAVRLGRPVARRLFVAALVCAFAAPAVLAALGVAPPWTLVALLAAPLARRSIEAVLHRTDGPSLNRALAETARLHLVFGLGLAAGLLA